MFSSEKKLQHNISKSSNIFELLNPLSNSAQPTPQQSFNTSHQQQQISQQQYHSQFLLPKIYVSTRHYPNHFQSTNPANELLDRRRRNADASARFRARRKEHEKWMQEKCQLLESRVQELERMDSNKRINELEVKLMEVNNEREKLKIEASIKINFL